MTYFFSKSCHDLVLNIIQDINCIRNIFDFWKKHSHVYLELQVDLLKSETKVDIDAKEKQMKMLQQTLKGMQEQLMQSRKQQAQDDQKIKDLTVKLNAGKKEEPDESEVITLDKDDDVNDEQCPPKPIVTSSGSVQISQKDAKLIGKSNLF